jgi:hypothetical protein
MTTLKEKMSEEAKKERAAKVRATRHRHKMETLFSEYQVYLSTEEKAMWEKKPEEEKEETALQWDCQQSCSPNCCHGKGGEGTSNNKGQETHRQNIDS